MGEKVSYEGNGPTYKITKRDLLGKLLVFKERWLVQGREEQEGVSRDLNGVLRTAIRWGKAYEFQPRFMLLHSTQWYDIAQMG